MEHDIDQAFSEHRRVLIDVAYRLLGSVTDAEDAVQEAFARLTRERVHEIEDVRAWLVVVVSRICLDQLGSARARREAYVGPWLPEPLVGIAGSEADPSDRVTLDDTVRMAMLVVLEQLTPPERVAFVLHDVFAYSFDEIAATVGRSPAACRQLASRARRRVREEGSARFEVDHEHEEAVAARFLAACRDGDVDSLAEALDPDVVLRADGGGLVQAPRRPVTGAATVVKIVVSGGARFPRQTFEPVTLNGGPGIAVYDEPGGALIALVALTVGDGRITEIDLLANPEKLAALA